MAGNESPIAGAVGTIRTGCLSNSPEFFESQPFFRHFKRFEHGARLVHGLLVFGTRNGVSDDARAGLKVGELISHQNSADDDAGIEIAGEIEIEDGTTVEAAARGFKLVDNFHGADFGRAA